MPARVAGPRPFAWTTGGNRSDARTRGQIDVIYRRVEAIDMWLPVTMLETFESRHGADVERIRGEAQYGNYRRFQTSVRLKQYARIVSPTGDFTTSVDSD